MADLIDAALLSVVGWSIYLASPEWVHGLGDDGVFVGLVISTLYTTLGTSRVGRGQTLGKRLLKLQVLAVDGQPLSPLKAMLRTWIVAFVFYLSAFEVLFTRLLPADAGVAVIKLLQAAWLSTALGLVLLTAFHPAKRGLHDLLVGSVVIHKAQGFDAAQLAAINLWPTTRKWRVAVWAIGLLLVGGVINVGIAATRDRSDVELAQHQAWELMRGDPALRVANIKINTRRVKSLKTGETTSTSVVLVMAEPPQLREPVSADNPIIERLFRTTRDNLPPTLAADVLQVGVVTGFNLGIAKRLTTIEFAEGYADPGLRQQVARTTRY